MKTANRELLRFFLQLCRGYWQSNKKWTAWVLLTGTLLLNLGVVDIMLRINEWDKGFYDVLQMYDVSSFWGLIQQFLLLMVLYVFLYTFAIYVQQMLQIKWRSWMTDGYLADWMRKQVYYRMKVLGSDTDNPDQRISEDISQFAELSLQLFVGFFKQFVTVIGFGVVLWNLSEVIMVPLGSMSFEIHGYILWCSLLYAIVGTYLAHRVGRRLIGLSFEQQRFEADFRFSMMRARENSESIAFYDGEAVESSGFRSNFANVIRNYWGLMRQNKLLNFYASGYGQIAVIFPIFLVMPSYFSGALMLGGFMQAIGAFEQVQAALSYFVDSYATIAELVAVTQRLYGFTEHMQAVSTLESDVSSQESAVDALGFENIMVQLPDGRTLLQDCTLTLAAGSHTLITGPSGCGKSTLLRTTAGLWPFGHGTLKMPKGCQVFFLPQRPYLPMGSLRRAVYYPLVEQKDDTELRQILHLVGMDKVIDQLDVVDDWSRILSLGEQQRIAFARVLLMKPQWVFLDEATSALDEGWERTMYELLKKKLPATGFISVGHRSSLFVQHEEELHLTGDGNWNLRPISV